MSKESSLYEAAKAGISSLLKQFTLVFIVVFIILLVTGGYVSGASLGVGFVLGTIFIAVSQRRQSLQTGELENARMSSVVINPNFNPVIAVMAGDQEKSILNLSGVVNTGSLSNITGSTLLSKVSGDVTNSINQLPDSSQSDDLDVKKLLSDLQVAIQSSGDLSDDAKTDALEQVKTLAEAVQNSNKEERKGVARKAITFLMGTIALLSPAAKLVEIGKTILPMIGDWFSK